jgi:hypothetical protein
VGPLKQVDMEKRKVLNWKTSFRLFWRDEMINFHKKLVSDDFVIFLPD